MITGINEPKTLTKHISCNCKCKFDEKNVIQINGACEKRHVCEKKIMFEILLHVVVKMENIYQVLWMIQQLRVMKL